MLISAGVLCGAKEPYASVEYGLRIDETGTIRPQTIDKTGTVELRDY
jgi:hypothetical protein